MSNTFGNIVYVCHVSVFRYSSEVSVQFLMKTGAPVSMSTPPCGGMANCLETSAIAE